MNLKHIIEELKEDLEYLKEKGEASSNAGFEFKAAISKLEAWQKELRAFADGIDKGIDKLDDNTDSLIHRTLVVSVVKKVLGDEE